MIRSSSVLSRGVLAASLATVAVAAAGTVTALAVGYAGTPPVPAPQGSFQTTVTSSTVVAGSPTTLSSGAVALQVPAGALPAGTQVSVLQGNQATLQSMLPAGAGYLDGFAVGWVAPDGSTPNATSPLSFTVHDSRITASDLAYQTTATGLTPTTASISAGQATFTFSSDPGFVVASPAAAAVVPNGAGNAGGGAIAAATGNTGSALPAAGIAALIVAVLAAVIAVPVSRRRQHGV